MGDAPWKNVAKPLDAMWAYVRSGRVSPLPASATTVDGIGSHLLGSKETELPNSSQMERSSSVLVT